MEALEQSLTGKSLHDSDLVAWATSSAAKLRQGEYLDESERDQIAEELLDIAGNNRREIMTRMVTLLMHLLKCEFQPDKKSRSWISTINDQRDEIEELLKQSPSLVRHLEQELPKLYSRSRRKSKDETGLNTFPGENPFTLNQILHG